MMSVLHIAQHFPLGPWDLLKRPLRQLIAGYGARPPSYKHISLSKTNHITKSNPELRLKAKSHV